MCVESRKTGEPGQCRGAAGWAALKAPLVLMLVNVRWDQSALMMPPQAQKKAVRDVLLRLQSWPDGCNEMTEK